MNSNENKGHIFYFDFLRIISTVAVIILHVAAQNWATVDISSFEWKVFNIFDSAVRFSVPMFVMISGALFLNNDKKISIKNLYLKNILRIATAFIFWSLFYAIDKLFMGVDIKTAVMCFIEGNYHMWFLFMIVLLYAMVPVLRKVTESKQTTEYFIVVGLVVSFLIPRTIFLLQCLDLPIISKVIPSINSVYLKMMSEFGLGYIIYFVIGYYLARFGVSNIWQKIFYFLAIVGIIAIAFLTDWHSNKIGGASVGFYNNFSISNLFVSVGVFLFVKERCKKSVFTGKSLKSLKALSKYSFGTYLVHAFVLDKLNIWFNINTLSFNPIVSVCVIVFCVTLVSYAISVVINQIPLLKKYIV